MSSRRLAAPALFLTLALFIAHGTASAAPGDIGTFAGGGAGDGSTPLNAAVAPGGVAVDAADNVIIADTTNCRVRRLTPGGVISTIAGTGVCGYSGDAGPATGAQLNFPQAVAVAASGDIYIADTVNCRIRRVDTLGVITTFAGTGVCVYGGDGGAPTSAQFANPQGVAVSAAGDIYVADSDNCRLRKISAGVVSTFAGTASCGFAGDGGPATSASLSQAAAVWVDGVNNVYVADTNNCRVRVVSPGGSISTVAGNGVCGYTGDGMTAYTSAINRPRAVTTDAAGDVYIADTDNCRLRKVEYPLVTISTVAGDGDCNFGGDGGTATSAKLRLPGGVAAGPSDLWIGDSGNCRVRRITAGNIATVAGTGACGYGGDGGPAANAALDAPGEVAVDAGGNLYVADTQNCRIRRVTPAGVISTFAGTGACGYGGDGGLATSAVLNRPRGVTVDITGAVFIADTDNCRIRRVSAGAITTVAGSGVCGYGGDGGLAASAQLNYPQSVAASGTTLYVADTLNCRIRRISGTTITTLAGDSACAFDGDGGPPIAASFNFPYGVAADAAGAVYVADTFNCRIRKVSGGTVRTLAGTGACASGGDGGDPALATVNRPGGLAVDANGSIFIADTDSCRTRLIAGNTILASAGTGACGFAGDGGPAPAAQLRLPADLALDAAGNVYIADTQNDRIRRLLAGADNDGDGVADAADNCPLVANAPQINSDRNFVDQSPPYGIDDLTWITSDPAGDACDGDDDNDGLTDAQESAGSACAGTPTTPLVRDTDGDRVLDGAECAIGTDPTSSASRPSPAQCAAILGVAITTDTDGDKLRDHTEYCGYNSNRLNVNTDGDICGDGKEVASINMDNAVNSGDQLILGQEISRVINGMTPVPNLDLNKDGNTNSGDQLFQAQQFGTCV